MFSEVSKNCLKCLAFQLPLCTIAEAENAEKILEDCPRQFAALVRFLRNLIEVSYLKLRFFTLFTLYSSILNRKFLVCVCCMFQ